jgi:hypothetical protein
VDSRGISRHFCQQINLRVQTLNSKCDDLKGEIAYFPAEIHIGTYFAKFEAATQSGRSSPVKTNGLHLLEFGVEAAGVG